MAARRRPSLPIDRLVFITLPFGRPALSASRTGPVVPAHSGDDQEQFEAERELQEDALFPALRATEGAALSS